jgi:hypothetical protein
MIDTGFPTSVIHKRYSQKAGVDIKKGHGLMPDKSGS